jgi:hypothetical protein
MNRRFAFLVVLVLCIVGIGFYRNWFTVTSPSLDTESHKVNVSLTVDPDKVKADAETVKEKAAELTGQAAGGANEPVDQAGDKLKSDEQ